MLAADGIADTILTNGAIYSVDPAQPWETTPFEAIAIDDDVILAIGTNAEVLALKAAYTRVLDLEGRMVLPGFHDVHTHILEAFSSVNTVPLDGETPLRDLIPALQGQQPHPATGWVLGGGQTIDQFFELTENPKDILDEAIPTFPAAMLEATSHSIWVNSAALTAAGITDATPDPPGGVIERDPVTGEATGLLVDSAVDLIFDIALAQNDQLDQLNYEGLLEGLATFNQFGVTSVGDARLYKDRGQLDVWNRTATEDTLSVRANLGLWASPYANDTDQIASLKSLFSNDPNSLLKLSEVKLYSDGITENGTAAFIDPYVTQGYAGPNGLKYFETERLQQYITELEQVGFTFNIHTIGDKGVRDALTAIEQAGVTNSTLTDRRHRLTHVENVHPDDIARFAALGVIADFQVGGEILNAENREFLREQIGDRADSVLPVRSIFDTGATVVFSSDYDVNSASPFVGIEKSLTRTDGQQLPALKDAIEAYTINAAYAMRQDTLVGSLTAGKLADLVVLDQNLFTIPQNEINTTSAVLTLLGGEPVHGETVGITFSNTFVNEGNWGTGTLTRSGSTGDLVVTLTSSDTSELTVPGTVTIRSGQTSARFRFTGVTDESVDGNQTVQVRVSAANQIAGVASIEVVDQDLAVNHIVVASGTGSVVSFQGNQIVVVRDGSEMYRKAVESLTSVTILGGPADDTVTINATGLVTPSGGISIAGDFGTNRLAVTGADASLDLTDPLVRVENFGVIDLSSTDATTVVLDAAAVTRLAPATATAALVLDGLDNVVFKDAGDWRMSAPVQRDGNFMLVASHSGNGGQRIEAQVAHPWRNIIRTGDVNNDGEVTASDALRIINELGRRQFSDAETQNLAKASDTTPWPGVYFDHNADDRVTALDALRVINELARLRIVVSEGEDSAATDSAIDQLLSDEEDEEYDRWLQAFAEITTIQD